MSTKIFPIKSGVNTCYIIKEEGVIMIDGGPPNMRQLFLQRMKEISLDPEEIQLIVLTHGHWDHIASSRDLLEITKARIAIHKKDRIHLEEGKSGWPTGVSTWGKVSRTIFRFFLRNKMVFPIVKADIILDNQDKSLRKYGVDGKIIHTPGHSSGSVSVLLDSGEAFVGDLAMNGLPFTLKPSLPIYAENIEEVKTSLKNIINAGAKLIFPGHGKPFSSSLIQKYL